MQQNSQTKGKALKKAMSPQELFEKFRETSLQTPIPETSSAVLFIGVTKEGKSTLMAYLKDVACLQAVKILSNGQERLVFVSSDPEDDYGIGQGFGSRTKIPKNHEIYWDLPGIGGDLRGEDQDILNAWSIRNLCIYLERIKIVLVISEGNLDYEKLINVLKPIKEVFPEIDQNLSSLCMVITKKQYTNINGFKESLISALEEEEQNLDPIVYNLLEHFSQKGPIVSFSRPINEGPANENEREEIMKAIREVVWYEKPKIGFGVSATSKNILLELMNAEFDDFSQFIKEIFNQMLNQYVNKIISSHTGSTENLQLVLKNLWSSLGPLTNETLKIQDSLDRLKDLGLQMNEEELTDFVLSKQKYFGFFAQLEDNASQVTTRNVADSFSFLSSTLKLILLKLEKPELCDFSQFVKENLGQMLNKYINEMRSLHTGNIETVLKNLWSNLDALTKSPLELQGSLNILQDLSLRMKEEKLKDFVLKKQKSFGFLVKLARSLPKLENDPPLVMVTDVTGSFSFLNQIMKSILKQLRNAEIADLSQFIKENLGQMLNQHVNDIINSHTGSAENLKVILKNLWSSLNTLTKSLLKLQDSLEVLKDLSLQIKDEKLRDFVLNKEKFFGLIAQLASDPSWVMAKNVAASFSFLTSTFQELSTFLEKPQIQCKQKTVFLTGRIIRSQDINEALSQYSEISEVNVDSSDVIFIDADIKFPGGRLALKSPQVQVVGLAEIDLAGREGPRLQIAKTDNGVMSEEYSELKAESGGSGIPGLPGENGGEFFVETEDFKNSSNLKVDVSGGRGGPGQDGGDGADGVDGREETAREKVTNRDEAALKSIKEHECQTAEDYAKKFFKTILTYNTKFIFEYSYFEKGQPGGDGGIGGKGGCGGSSGEVRVGEFPLGKIVKENGPMGIDGATGENGLNGENGPEYRGVYVEEKVFSGVRGIKPGDMRTTTERMVAVGTFAEAMRVDHEKIIENATLEGIESSLKAGVTVGDVGATTVKVGATSADVGVTATKVALTATKVGVAALNVGGIAAKVSATTALNVGVTAGTVATSLATSFGLCLAVKGVASFVCAKFSDEWIEKPHKVL